MAGSLSSLIFLAVKDALLLIQAVRDDRNLLKQNYFSFNKDQRSNLINLHILIALESHVPTVEHEILPECLYNGLVLHEMITEYICEYTLAVMQVNGQ